MQTGAVMILVRELLLLEKLLFKSRWSKAKCTKNIQAIAGGRFISINH